MRRAPAAGIAIAAIGLILAGPALAESVIPALGGSPRSTPKGPLPLRGQFALDLVTIDLTPSPGLLPPEGTASWRVRLEHANTFEITPNHPPAAAAADAGVDPGGWAAIVDVETTRLVVAADFRLRGRWSFGFELPFVAHRGGFLDSSIEDFHDAFGLPQNGRELRPRDAVDIDLIGRSASRKRMTRGETSPGDASIRARVQVARGLRSAWAVEMIAKAPTGDEDAFAGSGRWDGGVALLHTRGNARHYLHAGAGFQALGQPVDWPFDIRNRAGGFAAWEFAPNERFSFVTQLAAATSILPKGQDRQHRPRAELSLGMHYRTGSFRLATMLMENLLTHDNDVDLAVGVELGWDVGR